MFKNGDVIFFKECKNGVKGNSPGVRFAGFGIGLFLGMLKPFQKAPDALDAIRIMGATGFISFDDITEFLGEEQAKLCVEKFELKYYANQDSEPQVVSPEGRPVLVGADGKTLLQRVGLQDTTSKRRFIPIVTSEDVKKRLQSLTPEQIKEKIGNAKTDAGARMKRELTVDEEKKIHETVCAALNVDSVTFCKKNPNAS